MKKPILRACVVAAAVVAAGALGFVAGAQDKETEKPARTLKVNEIARVGDDVISAEEFIQRIVEREKIYMDADQRSAGAALDSLLAERLLLLESERIGARPNRLELTAEFERMQTDWEKNFQELNKQIVKAQRESGLEEKPYSREEFLKLKYDMTPLEFENHQKGVARELLTRRMVINYWRFSTDSAEAEGIKMRSLADIKKVRERLVKGESFSLLARQFSEDMHTRQNGGLLGTAYRKDGTFDFDGTQDTTAEDAFWALKEGDTSEPIKVGDFYWLLRKVKFYPANEAEFFHQRDACIKGADPSDTMVKKWRYATAAGGLYTYERRMPGWDCKAGDK